MGLVLVFKGLSYIVIRSYPFNATKTGCVRTIYAGVDLTFTDLSRKAEASNYTKKNIDFYQQIPRGHGRSRFTMFIH